MSTLVLASLVAITMVIVSLATPLSASSDVPKGVTSGVCGLPSAVKGKSARLPTHLKPIHYRIRLMPFIWPGNFTTAGELDVSVDCLESAYNVTLNAKDIAIDEESIRVFEEDDDHQVLGERMLMLRPQSSVANSTDQTFVIHTADQLKRGRKYRVQLRFVSNLNDILQGFYRSSYVDSATGEKRWLAVTQFSPVDARRAYPCFDEPAMKATFQVSIARTLNMTSHSNMPLNSTDPIEGMPGWVWDHFQNTRTMSTYLTAFLVSDFETLGRASDHIDRAGNASDADDVPFRVWCRRDALEQTRYARDISPRILGHYEEYFGIPFPLPKVDMVAVPDFGFNAMENWGIITFRESALLFDPKATTTMSKQNIAMVIGHELAHQWFGNLVTPAWWDDLWLKEGFASYVEYIGVNYVEPTWTILDQFPYIEIQNVFFLDSLESSHQISVPVDDPSQIRQIFDSISYGKGASIIRMMNHFLGEKSFRAGLKLYLTTYSYSNAVQDDLWEALTTAGHENDSLPESMTVKEVMDTWTLQTGYPVVTVVRDYENGNASLIQTRFLLAGENKSKGGKQPPRWWIPVSYTTQDKPDFENTLPSLWMNPDDDQPNTLNNLPNGSYWILLNTKETGFYRVNYDPENWNLIRTQLQDQAARDSIVIPPIAKSQLLDDSLNLARAGHISYSIALDLCLTLKKDTEYLPWASAYRALKYLDLMLTNTTIYTEFKDLMVGLSRTLIDSVGWGESTAVTEESEHITALKRAIALRWACHWGDQGCVSEAKTRYDAWMGQTQSNGAEKLEELNRNSTYEVSPDLQGVVYCTGIKYGSTREWEYAWQRYLSSNVGTERDTLLDSLGCTRETSLLKKYLSGVLNSNSGIRKQDGARAFAAVAKNPLGSQAAFEFLKNNWNQLLSYYGLAFSRVASMITATTTSMNTETQLNELTELWKNQQGNLGTTGRTFNQSIETVEANVSWMERSFQEVKRWIESHEKFMWI